MDHAFQIYESFKLKAKIIVKHLAYPFKLKQPRSLCSQLFFVAEVNMCIGFLLDIVFLLCCT